MWTEILLVVALFHVCESANHDGGWSAWSNWSTCSPSGQNPRHRTRSCDNPSPSPLGRSCYGRKFEEETCTKLRPVFSAYTAFEQLAAGSIPTFRNVSVNIGNAFDKTTGKFTCPISGLYQFSASMGTLGSTPVTCTLYRNGNATGFGVLGSMEAFLRISKGDVIYLYDCRGWEQVESVHFTMFSGSFISDEV